jgi:hypothetical protein
MSIKQPEKVTPDFHPIDYVKFFGAGALAACGTHAVCPRFSAEEIEY